MHKHVEIWYFVLADAAQTHQEKKIQTNQNQVRRLHFVSLSNDFRYILQNYFLFSQITKKYSQKVKWYAICTQ